jgi:aryl-alcohol dehydrogenase-like predicted oxidoreductase
MRAAQTVRELAEARQLAPGQIALAWVMQQGHDIVAIPGTRRRTYLEQNVAAAAVTLNARELDILDHAMSQVAGPRYNAALMALVNR